MTICQARLQFDFTVLNSSQMNAESQHHLSGYVPMFIKHSKCGENSNLGILTWNNKLLQLTKGRTNLSLSQLFSSEDGLHIVISFTHYIQVENLKQILGNNGIPLLKFWPHPLLSINCQSLHWNMLRMKAQNSKEYFMHRTIFPLYLSKVLGYRRTQESGRGRGKWVIVRFRRTCTLVSPNEISPLTLSVCQSQLVTSTVWLAKTS